MDFFQYLKVLTILMFSPIISNAQIESGKVGEGKLSKPKKTKQVSKEKPVIENPNTILITKS